MRTPNNVLNTIQLAIQVFVSNLDLGRRIDKSRSGTAGSRKRASWWGTQLRRRVPDMADSTGKRGTSLIGAEKNR